MNAAALLPSPRRVTATAPALPVAAPLNYLQANGSRPFSYACPPPEGTPWESHAYTPTWMPINDARLAQGQTSIHREGFELWDAPTAVQDFQDDAQIRSLYYAESAALALTVTGARWAHVFDHLLRRREPNREAVSFGRQGSDGRAAVNGRIHNDYTEASGRARLARVLGEDAATQVKRFAIVNIWRAINGPVRDTPLAVCDARSVAAQDLVDSDVRYPRRVGEIYHAVHAPQHRWSYFSLMAPHEALVFKQYDSQPEGVARFVLHTAFDLPRIPADAPLRESIELRCLVVFE